MQTIFTDTDNNLTVALDPGSKVWLNGAELTPQQIHIVLIALRRQFLEISASIDGVLKGERKPSGKVEAVLERRRIFSLIELFDGVFQTNARTVALGPNRMEINGTLLDQEDVELIENALIWYRNNWVYENEPGYTIAKSVLILFDAH